MTYMAQPVENEADLSCCDEKTKSFLLANHDKWTIEQMNEIINYLSSKINSLNESVEENLTIEDFEKAKKIDIDNDGEEGEV